MPICQQYSRPNSKHVPLLTDCGPTKRMLFSHIHPYITSPPHITSHNHITIPHHHTTSITISPHHITSPHHHTHHTSYHITSPITSHHQSHHIITCFQLISTQQQCLDTAGRCGHMLPHRRADTQPHLWRERHWTSHSHV